MNGNTYSCASVEFRKGRMLRTAHTVLVASASIDLSKVDF